MNELVTDIKRMRSLARVSMHRQDLAAQPYAECEKLLTKYPDNLELLVLKATLIQLMPKNSNVSLEDARKALKKALSIDAHYIPALIELGWFIYACDDNAKKASTYFIRAMELATRYADDCASLIGDCCKEMRLKKGCGHKNAPNDNGISGTTAAPVTGLGKLEKSEE